jgi:hypothetical protein
MPYRHDVAAGVALVLGVGVGVGAAWGVVTGGTVGDDPPPQPATAASATAAATRLSLSLSNIIAAPSSSNETPRLMPRGPRIK